MYIHMYLSCYQSERKALKYKPSSTYHREGLVKRACHASAVPTRQFGINRVLREAMYAPASHTDPEYKCTCSLPGQPSPYVHIGGTHKARGYMYVKGSRSRSGYVPCLDTPVDLVVYGSRVPTDV